MKHIIATDYDGTLYLYHQNGITEKVKNQISEFRKNGNYFGVVTGRSYIWAYPVFKKQNLFEFDYIMSDNGAQCTDKDGNIVFSEKIKAYKGFAKDYMEKTFSFGDELEEIGLCLEKERYNFLLNNPEGTDYYNKHADIEKLCELDEFVMVNAVCKDADSAERLRKIVVENFGDILCPARNDRCLDITAVGVNKASGIRKYAEIMGVDLDNIYAAGDNFNDLVMVEAFHGCAVENAVDALKEKAEYIIEDVGDIVKMIFAKENING